MSLTPPAQPTLDVIYTRGAILVKGFTGPSVDRFARDEAQGLMMIPAPVTSVLMDAIKPGPCAAAGSLDIAADLGGLWRDGPSLAKLMRATGKATMSSPGEIAFSITFDTDPVQPAGQPLTYVGRLSFRAMEPALPDDADIGGFSVVAMGRETFEAPPAMTLAELRARLAQAR